MGTCLVALDQVANAARVGFVMAMAGQRVGPGGGLNDDIGPNHTGRNVHRRDLRHGDAFLIAAKKTGFDSADALRVDLDAGGEKQVSPRPSACDKNFGGGNSVSHGPSYTHSKAPFFQTQT